MSAPDKPNLHKQKSNLRFFAGDANVGRERDAGAGAGSRAVRLAITGLRQRANVCDQLASHARKLEQAFHVAAEEFADDVVHVAAGAERSAGAGDHNNAHVSFIF